MDWQVHGESAQVRLFDDLEISEVLIEYDGPRLFYAKTELCPMLLMLVDENEQRLRHLAVPANEALINNLKKGLTTVRDALTQPLLWVVDMGLDYSPLEAWRSSITDLPESILPEKGIMLWPHLQPAFTLRAIGNDLSEGAVPASVIRQVIDGASTALRKAALHVIEEPSRQGRVKKSLKRLYDLPAQKFSYNSFEIAFGLPSDGSAESHSILNDDENEMVPVGEALARAISASLSNDGLDSLDITLLEALEKIVPPLSGIVYEFEVGGRIISSKGHKYLLNRNVSQRVKTVLKEVRGREEKVTTLQGVVSEMDRDNLTFTLRQTSDGNDHICTFPADMFDEVMEAFSQALPVTVGGRETLKNGNISISLFTLTEPPRQYSSDE